MEYVEYAARRVVEAHCMDVECVYVGVGGCMSVPMRVCTLCPVVTCAMSLLFSDCNHCMKLCDTFLASIQREISDEVQSPDLNFSQPDTVRISSDI